jgi:Major tropism determinant N-terminal domain/Pectate lyase superfamily protein
MSTRIQKRRDTAANWASVNPVLAAGEEGWDTDNRRSKTGDGSTAWASLGYDDEEAPAPTGVAATDTASIQARIDAKAAAGGGTVRLRPGTYSVNATVVVKDKVHLIGAGVDATIIKLANTTNLPVVQTLDFATLVGGDTTGGPGNFSIRDLTIDGNSANNATTAPGLQIYGYSYVLSSVVVRNTRTLGVHSEWWSGTPSTDTYNGLESKWIDVKVHHCTGAGVYFNGPHDTTWLGGEVFTCTTTGIEAKGLRAVRVHVWGATHATGWKMVSGCHLVSCEGEGASTVQFLLQGNDQELNECYAYKGNANAAASYGIQIGDGSNPCSGYRITGKVLDCGDAVGGGTINFSNDAGAGKVDLVAYQAAGTMLGGTVHATTDYAITASGSATKPTYLEKYSTTRTLQRTASATFDGDVTIRPATSSALRVFLNATQWLNWDSINKLFALWNGGRFRTYSGSSSGQTWQVDGATGYVTFGTSTGPQDMWGSGTPEGSKTAPVGSTYRRTDGGAGTSFYIKESGTGNTGWRAV